MNVNTLPAQSVTGWLLKWREGDESALGEVSELVYQDLRRLAQSYLRKEHPGHTLQATALVHEAYLQVRGLQYIEWKNKAQFIGVVAQVMRHVLVDHARRHAAQKRGGATIRVPLSRAERIVADAGVDLIELNDALDKLAAKSDISRRKAHVIELFYFGGLSVAEIAEVLSGNEGKTIKAATVEKDLKNARAWLYQTLST